MCFLIFYPLYIISVFTSFLFLIDLLFLLQFFPYFSFSSPSVSSPPVVASPNLLPILSPIVFLPFQHFLRVFHFRLFSLHHRLTFSSPSPLSPHSTLIFLIFLLLPLPFSHRLLFSRSHLLIFFFFLEHQSLNFFLSSLLLPSFCFCSYLSSSPPSSSFFYLVFLFYSWHSFC